MFSTLNRPFSLKTPNHHPANIPPQKDISARSPVVDPSSAAPQRQSLDSRVPRLPYHRTSLAGRRPPLPPTTAEESNFEDVGLNDDNNLKSSAQAAAAAPPKKRGFFSKFASDENDSPTGTGTATGPASGTQSPHGGGGIASRFLPGRKRGQSGQGAELGVLPLGERPRTATIVETEVQS